uniref:Uncharacterized protein n=1 Tax=viral metagenome TaxID=1070528 RepID=A0A2V0R9T0_9ZZZZ
MSLKFSSDAVYAALSGEPICRLKGSGDSEGADDAPEGAPAVSDIVGTLFNRSPNLDVNVQISAVGGDLDSRVHFVTYLSPAAAAGSVDNMESVMHVCHDMINDPSRIYSNNNVMPSHADFDAANISRAVRTVFPAMNVADQNGMAQGLAAFGDFSSKYTGLWMRLISLSLALDAGLNPIAALGNMTSAGQQVAGFVGAAGAPAMLAALNVSAQGGTGITFLPVDAAPTLFNDAARRAFAAVSLVNCGVVIGPTRRSLVSLFDSPHNIYFYGSANRMNNQPFNAGALAAADCYAAMRFLMSTTGDVEGLNDALGLLARRVRFMGPRITNLAAPIDEKFHNLSPQVMQWFNIFFCAFARDKDGEANRDAELQAALNANAAGGYLRARDRDATLARWGAEHQGLRALGETMYLCGSVNRFLLSLTTSEVTAVWNQIAGWNLRGANEAAPGDWIVQEDISAGITPGDVVLPADLTAPSWGTIQLDQSVSADGFTIAAQVPTCAGVAQLKRFMEGTANASLAANSKTKTPMTAFAGMALRRRIYLMAITIRCCSDVVFDSVDSCAAKDEYVEGAANTGNAVVDEMLDYETSLGENQVISSDELYSLVLVECGYYGVLTKTSVDDTLMFHYSYDDLGFSRNCVRCCFHPAIAKQFLGSDCGRSGGDYNYNDQLCLDIAGQFQEVWSNHKLENMRSSEVAALIQFIAATKGRSTTFATWVNIRVNEFGRDEQCTSGFMANDVCRPTENRIDLSVMTPSLWWYRPIYPGQLRLLSVGSQLRSGYNIVNGVRVESDPNTASNALNQLYNGNAIVHTGPARGSGRTRWLMRSNVLPAPAVIAPAPNGIGRDVAVAFTHELVGSINRLPAVSKVVVSIKPYFGELKPLKVTDVGVTADLIKRRIFNDAFGMVKLGLGVRKLLGFVGEAPTKSVGPSDF